MWIFFLNKIESAAQWIGFGLALFQFQIYFNTTGGICAMFEDKNSWNVTMQGISLRFAGICVGAEEKWSLSCHACSTAATDRRHNFNTPTRRVDSWRWHSWANGSFFTLNFSIANISVSSCARSEARVEMKTRRKKFFLQFKYNFQSYYLFFLEGLNGSKVEAQQWSKIRSEWREKSRQDWNRSIVRKLKRMKIDVVERFASCWWIFHWEIKTKSLVIGFEVVLNAFNG